MKNDICKNVKPFLRSLYVIEILYFKYFLYSVESINVLLFQLLKLQY